MRGATTCPPDAARPWPSFQSTHPLRGATPETREIEADGKHFNPRTPCGVRLCFHAKRSIRMDFNPRTPCGVRQHPVVLFITTLSNFNPRTPCGVRPCSRLPMHTALHFNPRTPCGVRRCRACCGGGGLNISIHAPLAGCDFINHNGEFIAHLFQSTHPLRGATLSPSPRAYGGLYFNPRTPCGVRPMQQAVSPPSA